MEHFIHSALHYILHAACTIVLHCWNSTFVKGTSTRRGYPVTQGLNYSRCHEVLIGVGGVIRHPNRLRYPDISFILGFRRFRCENVVKYEISIQAKKKYATHVR